MKYIRTEYGKLYDLEELNVPFMIVDDYIDFNYGGRSKIIKQADNIEELCDYVFYYNYENELVIRKLPLTTTFKSLIDDIKRGFVKNIKLAILTDKGLIYVAKMNEKGELELI